MRKELISFILCSFEWNAYDRMRCITCYAVFFGIDGNGWKKKIVKMSGENKSNK